MFLPSISQKKARDNDNDGHGGRCVDLVDGFARRREGARRLRVRQGLDELGQLPRVFGGGQRQLRQLRARSRKGGLRRRLYSRRERQKRPTEHGPRGYISVQKCVRLSDKRVVNQSFSDFVHIVKTFIGVAHQQTQQREGGMGVCTRPWTLKRWRRARRGAAR